MHRRNEISFLLSAFELGSPSGDFPDLYIIGALEEVVALEAASNARTGDEDIAQLKMKLERAMAWIYLHHRFPRTE